MSFNQLRSTEQVQFLSKLGLTTNQALIFCALTQMAEPATVANISKASGVAREKVYCILPRLQELCLVEKLLNRPARFKGIPLRKAITVLLEERNKDTAELRKKSKELLQNLDEVEKLEQNRDKETIVVCKREIGYENRVRAMEHATKSFDMLLPIITSDWWDFYSKRRVFKKILKNGAQMRLILQKPIEFQKAIKEIKALSKNPLFEFRYAKNPSTLMSLYIIDEKQVTIATAAENFPKDYSVILARTPVLVSLTLGYFETMWNNSFNPFTTAEPTNQTPKN